MTLCNFCLPREILQILFPLDAANCYVSEFIALADTCICVYRFDKLSIHSNRVYGICFIMCVVSFFITTIPQWGVCNIKIHLLWFSVKSFFQVIEVSVFKLLFIVQKGAVAFSGGGQPDFYK